MRGFPEIDLEKLIRQQLCHYCNTDCGPSIDRKAKRVCRWCNAEKAEGKEQEEKPIPSYCRGEA